MVEHGLLTTGDNTWQQILFHIMPRYIVSTIILNQKSKIRQKYIVSLICLTKDLTSSSYKETKR